MFFQKPKIADWFVLEEPKSLGLDNSFGFLVQIQGTKDIVETSRQVYNLLDALGDVGGLKDSL